jgi:hypothetical protein
VISSVLSFDGLEAGNGRRRWSWNSSLIKNSRCTFALRSEEAFRMEEFSIALLSEDDLSKILKDDLIATCDKNGNQRESAKGKDPGSRSYSTSQ